MKKILCLVTAFAFILGTIVVAIPPAKAQEQVRFYVFDGVDNIISGKTAGTTFAVDIWIDSPESWDNTPSGIVGYALSVRVDPRVLEVVGARKTPSMGGFLESFLVEYMYDFEYTTSLMVGAAVKNTGTIPDASEYIGAYKTLGVGAGGTSKLMQFTFKSLSATAKSPIDICGRPVPPIPTLEVMAIYTTPDGVDHYVDVMDDGWYVGTMTDVIYLDLVNLFDPMAPVGSTWHEILPTWCNPYTLTNWNDLNSNGALDVGDQVALTLDTTVTWWQVGYLNPTPIAGDAQWDLIMTKIVVVPEFPLGLGLLMVIAPAIPIVYLWRTRKKEMKK